MSNKKWRKPANPDWEPGDDVQPVSEGAGEQPRPANEPGPEEPDPGQDDPAAQLHAELVAELREQEVASTEDVALRRMPGPGPELAALPDDYLENGYGGDAPKAPPGCYRTAFGAGDGRPDLRLTVPALGRVDERKGPLSDIELEYIAADSVRFLWQVVTLTARVLETVELGDVRRAVAADMAMPGDIVMQDGSISRCRDAYHVGKDGNAEAARAAQVGSGSSNPDGRAADGSGARETGQAQPRNGAAPAGQNVASSESAETRPGHGRFAKAARRPRGATHPLLGLLRMAIQSARLIKQIGAGTNPQVMRKVHKRLDNLVDKFKAGEDWVREVAGRSG